MSFFDAFAEAFLDILNAVFLHTILNQSLDLLVIMKSQNLHLKLSTMYEMMSKDNSDRVMQ